MDDLISREDVKRLTTKRNNIWNEVTDAEGRGLDEILESLPSIDAVQVKHGKWTIEDCHSATYKYCCSECGAHHRAMYDYCPTCGACMED